MQKVYVIGPDSGPFKVGISSDPKQRLDSLQTGNHVRLSIHFEMDEDDAAGLEKRFHAYFAEKRLGGEWFEMPLPEITEALRVGIPSVEVTPQSTAMSALTFTAWLAEMKSAGLARSDAECGRLLGRSADQVVRYKQAGADRVVALACRALLHRLEPFS
jgi:hypothetical protein